MSDPSADNHETADSAATVPANSSAVSPDLNSALGELQTELERLRSAADQIETSKQAARDTVEAAQQVGAAVKALAGPTGALVERLDKVDFPSRLDKLDATTSSLGVGMQNVQGRLDGVERGVKDDLARLREDVERRISESQKAMLDADEKQAAHVQAEFKQVKMTLYGVIALLVVLLIVQFAV